MKYHPSPEGSCECFLLVGGEVVPWTFDMFALGRFYSQLNKTKNSSRKFNIFGQILVTSRQDWQFVQRCANSNWSFTNSANDAIYVQSFNLKIQKSPLQHCREKMSYFVMPLYFTPRFPKVRPARKVEDTCMTRSLKLFNKLSPSSVALALVGHICRNCDIGTMSDGVNVWFNR